MHYNFYHILDMAFAIVKFLSTEEVAVVPISWIKHNKCFWPPKNQRAKIMIHVDKGITPSEAWEEHLVQTMGIFGNVYFDLFLN